MSVYYKVTTIATGQVDEFGGAGAGPSVWTK
jgi:hypothetical protein